MRDFYESVSRLLQRHECFTIATIVRVAGSSPRDAGAKLVVLEDGSIEGTLGGGKLEAQVIRDARACLAGSVASFRSYALSEDGLGMKCGGKVYVYLEPVRPRERLVVFGGGHVGRAIARLAPSAGFRVEVVDDRAEQLGTPSFPDGVERVATDARFQEGYRPLAEDDYTVVVTRDAATDAEITRRHAGRCAYLGVMGSRAKRAFMKRTLVPMDLSEEVFDTIHCPMGVDVGSDTPEEIAVSVVAELIAVRAARRAVKTASNGASGGGAA